MTTVNYYRIYCSTEQTFVYVWNTSKPTTCPNNNTHTIDTNSITISDTVSKNEVKIQQYNNAVSAYYRTETVVINAPANQTTTQTYTRPINVSVLTINWDTDETNKGDIINMYVSPNTVIGTITQNINPGDPKIYVSSTAINFLKPGMIIKIKQDTSIQELGYCTEVNKLDNSIKCVNLPSMAMNSGSLVLFTLHNVVDFYLCANKSYRLAGKHLGTTLLPANTVVQISYQNNGNTDKTFVCFIDYLY